MVSLPGGNILGMANRVIAAQKPMYRPFIKRESNAAGVFELWYATPVALTANIQPVPRSVRRPVLVFGKAVSGRVENVVVCNRRMGCDTVCGNAWLFAAVP